MQRSRTARRLPMPENCAARPASVARRACPTASGHGNGSRARRHRTDAARLQAPLCGCRP
ncbi:hypothetical protein K525DRAFT_257183, partial [Schizophyllum commune Loenen D]